MIDLKNKEIAVIGGRELATGLRLAGMSKFYLIEGEGDVASEVKKALTELVDGGETAIIVIQEDYVERAQDMINRLRGARDPIPVIIEVPSKYGTKYPDVKSYYKAYIRKFIGFDVEL
ncbi:V-type ATP synthase subunit F [Chloroflexota bacterium]